MRVSKSSRLHFLPEHIPGLIGEVVRLDKLRMLIQDDNDADCFWDRKSQARIARLLARRRKRRLSGLVGTNIGSTA